MLKQTPSGLIAQVAQVAEKICFVLFEQRVFSIINAYAKPNCYLAFSSSKNAYDHRSHFILHYSSNILYTSKIKVDHIAISNNTIYLTDANTYTLYMYNLITKQQTVSNFAYSHWANRKLEPIGEPIDDVTLNINISNIHVENSHLIVNMGYAVIKYTLTNSCYYVMDRRTSECYFNKLMYRIATYDNNTILCNDEKFIKLSYAPRRLYVGHYIIISEIIMCHVIVHIYDKNFKYSNKKTKYCDIDKKICSSYNYIFFLSAFGILSVCKCDTCDFIHVTNDIMDIFVASDLLFTLDRYNNVTKYEFN